MVARGPSVRLAICPVLTQPETASPSSRPPRRPSRRSIIPAAALAASRPDPLCIDFPAGPAALGIVDRYSPSRHRPGTARVNGTSDRWRESRAAASIFQRYRADVAPVVGFLAVGGAAVAEEPRRIGVGAKAEILHPADAGGSKAGGDVAGQIEQGVTGSRRGLEKALVGSVVGFEAGHEFRPDL